MFGLIPFVKKAGRGLGAMIKGRKGKEVLEKDVEGVGGVQDQATSRAGGRESQFHTVKSGDTLSAISKTYYGTWRLYPEIFEANKPMLTHPDKIYPGQVLRIPAIATATS